MANRKPGFFRTALALVAIATSGTLAGCSNQIQQEKDALPHHAPTGGQTLASARAALSAIPGLNVEQFDIPDPNTKLAVSAIYRVELVSGYQIANGPAFVEYLTRLAWSVRDTWQPRTDIDITVAAPGQPTFNVGDAAAKAGWAGPGQTNFPTGDNGSSSFAVHLDLDIPVSGNDDHTAKNNLAKLGDWPGAVPTLPAGTIVKQ